MNKDHENEQPAEDLPKTQSISISEYAHSVGELTAQIARRHKIPPGVAFNVVAWSTQHLEQQAEQARYAREAALQTLKPKETPDA